MSTVTTEYFRGYNRHLKIQDGEFYDTGNLSNDDYPVLRSRKPHGLAAETVSCKGMLGKDALAWIDGTTLYFNGAACTFPAGVSLTTGEKQLIGMGAYICIFPDKVYYNTVKPSDSGYMEQKLALDTTLAAVTYQPCMSDGTLYEDIEVSSVEPTNPTNGMLWMDTSMVPHSLKVYSDSMRTWSGIAEVFTKISATGISNGFAQYDAVDLSGISYSGTQDDVAEQAAALNGNHILYSVGTGWIVVQGLLDISFQQTSGTIHIDRTVPDMDYITESENRLWGCKYGLVQGEVLNEIYACALGDPKNWRRYMGISTDSYAVSIGSDGPFTGAVTYQGYPTFFKESAIHKIYGSQPSNYQLVTNEVRGVEQGSSKSLAIVGSTLYYKSKVDICSWDGSQPVKISDALGDTRYTQAVASAWNGKYVICMNNGTDRETFIYDTRRQLWIREGKFDIRHAAQIGEEMYACDANGKIWSMGASTGTPEQERQIEWRAETGIFGWQYTRHKCVSRFNIRMRLAQGAQVKAYFQYDSDGYWQEAGLVTGNGKTRTDHLFVIPHRCDHMQLRLDGIGRCEILSIARVLEEVNDL